MAGTRLELRPDTGELGRLVAAVEAFASAQGLDPATAGRLTLALDEIVTNAIVHGRLPADAPIGVELRVDGADVVATVSDSGPAFDPLVDSAAAPVDAAAPLEDRPIGGLGLHIVRRLARDMAYARDGTHNRLTLRLSR